MKSQLLLEFEAFKTSDEMTSVMRYVEERLQLAEGDVNYGSGDVASAVSGFWQRMGSHKTYCINSPNETGFTMVHHTRVTYM